MMDVDGPGAITRWWEGDHDKDAVIRVYLDGSDQPTIEENIVTLLSGTGQVKPPLAAVKSLGLNFYVPIPYARHCKVTYDKPGENHWYVIGYRTTPAASTPSRSTANSPWTWRFGTGQPPPWLMPRPPIGMPAPGRPATANPPLRRRAVQSFAMNDASS
jgi:hypothetical protein